MPPAETQPRRHLEDVLRRLGLRERIRVIMESRNFALQAAWTPPPSPFTRGYGRLYIEHVLQAEEGCDFDFCR